MPIFSNRKKSQGDLTGVPNRKSPSDISSQRAQQIKNRSQSGFKGEIKNDHGLPLGGNMKIIQTPDANQPGAKFRSAKKLSKYEDGTKKVKVDKNDPNFIGPPEADTKTMSFGSRSTDTPIGQLARPALADAPEARTDAQIADMQKVVNYQKKLVAAGAKIKVDGMWGKQTEAASRKYHSSIGSSKSSPKKEVVTGLQGGNIAASIEQAPTRKAAVKSAVKTMNLSDLRKQQMAAPKVDVDREARITERMYPDPEQHGGGWVNRKQAEKLIEIDDRSIEEGKNLIKGVGIAAGAGTVLAGAAYGISKLTGRKKGTMTLPTKTAAQSVKALRQTAKGNSMMKLVARAEAKDKDNITRISIPKKNKTRRSK
jgi:hypothetical protein